jgi:uncharacterized protein
MLVQFSVANFRSFSEKQTLSLVASNYFNELAENKVQPLVRNKKLSLLKTTAVYGANASGKSNLLKALRFMRLQVVKTDRSPNVRIQPPLFKLTQTTLEGVSEFEAIFVEGGKTYQYGFCCNETGFTEEWLHIGSKQVLHRKYNTKVSSYDYPILKIKAESDDVIKVWQTLAKNPNSLFLPKAVSNGATYLQPVLDWFEKRLVITSNFNTSYSEKLVGKATKRQEILNFLHDMGLQDIVAIESKPVDLSKVQFLEEMPNELKTKFLNDLKSREDVFFRRKMIDSGETTEFNIESEESDGTQELFAFAGPFLDILSNGKVLLVDEIDSSLHPLVVHQLIEMVQKGKTKAQLIFTTHDTSILSKELLRRDQVWFTEKTPAHATELFSLADFSPRDGEAFEKRYLNGRYGGVPIMKNLDFFDGK